MDILLQINVSTVNYAIPNVLKNVLTILLPLFLYSRKIVCIVEIVMESVQREQ